MNCKKFISPLMVEFIQRFGGEGGNYGEERVDAPTARVPSRENCKVWSFTKRVYVTREWCSCFLAESGS